MIYLFSFDSTQQLNDLLKELIGFMPNFVSAIIVFLIGIIISKIIAKLVRKILLKIKIDKLAEGLNKIEFIDKADIKISLSNIISKFVYYFLLLIFLVLSTDILRVPVISNLLVDIFNFIPNVFVAFLIIIFGLLLANWLKGLVLTITKSLNIPSAGLIANLVFYFIFINVLISAMVQAKINVDFFSTNISLIIGGVVFAFALAYGLASKKILSNIISSFYYKHNYNISSEGNKIVIPISKLNDNVVIIKN